MTVPISPLTAPLSTPASLLPAITVSGNGVMGQLVRKALEADPTLSFLGCIGPSTNTPPGLIDYLSFSSLPSVPSGIIDFSHPDCLVEIIEYVMTQLEPGENKPGRRIPVVIATTGYSPDQIDQIHQLASRVPVVFSSNFSPGVTILTRILRELAPLMADWDVDIVEKHHRRKVDAPSGTALTLAKTLNRPLIYGRHGYSPRKDEIGIHAVRGGDIRGVHEVIFMGNGETLTLTHEALDRGLFAAGAVKAMKFALEQDGPGLWNMEDVLTK